jgi:amidase
MNFTVKIIFVTSLMMPLSYGYANAVSLEELTVKEAQRMMVNGDLSSEQLTQYYLDRIEDLDKAGAKLNAVGQINRHAIADAKKLDIERQQGHVRSSLHGIPVLVKDNIDTGDGMATTAGSFALQHNYPEQDAFVIKQLRQAGAVILGKTNLSEWANARSTHSSAGWSALYGQSKNPYDLTRSPCGSSSGSAIGVAADFTLLSVGTETDGSLICPGSFNGVVAIKPTLGLVSRSGIIPIAHSFDTPGPLARTVTDAVLLLQVMVAEDEDDAESVNRPVNYMQHLIKNGLEGKRIGIASNLLKSDRLVEDIFIRQVNTLRELGAIVVDSPLVKTGKDWNADKRKVFLMEFKTNLSHYLKTHNVKNIQSLADVIAFNLKNTDREMKYFAQEILELAQATQGTSDKNYQKLLLRVKRLSGEEGIDATLAKYELDLLISPTLAGPAPSIDLIYGGGSIGGSSSGPAAIAGYPHITVPMGQVHGMPVGLSFFGSKYTEGTLIEAAFAFEQATKARKKPRLASF